MKSSGETGAPDWQSALRDGERLLWHGRPVGDVFARRDRAHGHLGQILSILFFGGLAYFVVTMLSPALKGSFLGMAGLWLFVALMFLVVLQLTYGKPYMDAWARRRSWYALTDRRLLTARRGLFGLSLSKRNIHSTAGIFWDNHDPGDVTQLVPAEPALGTRAYRQGFYKIPEAGKVAALMHEAQAGLGGK